MTSWSSARTSAPSCRSLTFFAFGGLIVATGYHADIPLLVAFIVFALLIARPVAISLSFFRVGLPRPHQAFIAWFGPKGVAGILFAELVLNSDVGHANAIFETAALRDPRLDPRPRAHRHARRPLDRASNHR